MSSRRKSPWRDWRQLHLPRISSFVDGEMDHYLALVERDQERILEAKRADACCIECHALMLVSDGGFHYCPFERALVHARAIAHRKAELLAIQFLLLGEIDGNCTHHAQLERAA